MKIKSVNTSLSDLIERQAPSCSLEGAFYNDPEIYKVDMEHLVYRQWLLVDHESRIPNRGEYFVFEIDDESIILIRGSDNRIYAHYNVCCHRGSRICLKKQGKTNLLVCPYHSWSFRQDGTLMKAPYMPEDFDPNNVALKSCHLKVSEGLIFICLADTPPDFDENIAGIDKYFKLHSTAQCKIAHRHTLPTKANWKLVVENFLECYHCLAAHPELCSVRTLDMVISAGAGPSSGDSYTEEYQEKLSAFEEKAKAMDQLPEVVDDCKGEQWFRLAYRNYLKEGCYSESEDGGKMAPLLKGFNDWDCGYTGISINPLSHMLATNDAVFLFRFTPRGPLLTDVEVSWLVNNDAVEGKDYDLDRLKWGWETTANQDLIITEDTQKGVNSRAYIPHRLSIMETNIAAFCRWYLKNMQKADI